MHGSQCITGLILAGGRSRRMGGEDKSWLLYKGRPMIEHVFERLIPQVSQVIVSANHNLDHYKQLGCSVVEDELTGRPGPLGGIAAALNVCDTPWLLVAACDAPNIPKDLASRLYRAVQADPGDIKLAYPSDGEQTQHLFMLLNRDCLASLQSSLNSKQYGVMQWIRSQNFTQVDFSDCPAAFMNINTPEDLSC